MTSMLDMKSVQRIHTLSYGIIVILKQTLCISFNNYINIKGLTSKLSSERLLIKNYYYIVIVIVKA